MQDCGAEQQGSSADSDALGKPDCHFGSLDLINLASRGKSRLKRLYGIDRSDPTLIIAAQAESIGMNILIRNMALFCIQPFFIHGIRIACFPRSLIADSTLDRRVNRN